MSHGFLIWIKCLFSVEINIAWDNAYQILFDLGEKRGKQIDRYKLS